MYEKPEKTINLYGNNIYAYITYINNETLLKLPQLLTFAYSLIRSGSYADRICIITTDVSDDYVLLLQKFYIIVRTTDIHVHGVSFIKYFALGFGQYKKILLIHPNYVVLQNPDILFTLRTPAAHFRNNQLIPDLLLLEPSVGTFDSMIFAMKHSLIKIDEADYIYNKYFEYHWIKIDPSYLYGKNLIPNTSNVSFIYYTLNPPQMVLGDIHADDIYMVWFNLYKKMLEQYTDMIVNPLLTQTNKMLTNIIRSRGLQRDTEAVDDTEIAGLKNMYESGEIHLNLAKYYHKDKYNEFLNDDIDLIFDNIDNFDYMKCIERLNEYFNNNYYKSLTKYTTSEEKSLHLYNYIDINDRENIMRMYMRCVKNISIEILHGDIDDKNNKIEIDKFKLKGLYYIKTLNLSKIEYENLLFFLDYMNNFTNRINKIDKTEINDNNKIIFCFVNHQSQNYKKTIELGDIILNQNNLHRLKNQDIRNISSPFFSKSNLYVETLKRWINDNLSVLEQERLLLFGDIVLNSYGIKTINKIEGIFVSVEHDNSEIEKNLESTINQALTNMSTKLFFCNITKENTKEYIKYHKNIIDEIKEKAGVEKTSELVSNPNIFGTYRGIKILNLELNMIWMEHQKKLNYNTDVIMTNKINKNILSRFAYYDKDKNHIKLQSKIIKLNKKYINNIKKNASQNYIKKFITDLV
jgi:hypothetical protein